MKIAVYLFSSCIFIISAIKYMDYLLEYRANHKWSIYLSALFYLCVTTISYFSEFSIFMNTIMLLAMVVTFGCFFSNWKKIAVVASFLIVALFISETATFYIIELLRASLFANISHELILDIGNNLTKLTFPATLYFFAKMFQLAFTREPIPAKYLFGCISIPFLSIFVFYYIYISNMGGYVPLYYSLLAAAVIMIMNILILFIFIRLTEYYSAKLLMNGFAVIPRGKSAP